MTGRHVCAACRLRRAALLQQRRLLSYNQPRAQQLTQRLPSPRQDVPRLGRYSRQPLVPQQILEELKRPSPPTSERTSNAPLESPAAPRLPHPRAATSRNNLFRDKCMRLSHMIGGDQAVSAPDAQVLDLLLQIANDARSMIANDRSKPRAIFRALPESFQATCTYWLVDLSERWARVVLNGGDEPKPSSVRPIEAVRAIAALDWPTHPYLPAVLWSLASKVLAAKNLENVASLESIRTVMSELMWVWNLAMCLRLSPSIDSLDTTLADWSFLPDPTTVAKSLQDRAPLHTAERMQAPNDGSPVPSIPSHSRQDNMSEESANIVPLRFALGLVVPRDNFYYKGAARNLTSPVQEIGDLQSAALTTLDLLFQLQADNKHDEWTRQHQRWIQLMETIVRCADDSRIPPALARKLRDSETQALYQSVVERFTLYRPNVRANVKGSVADNAVQPANQIASSQSHASSGSSFAEANNDAPATVERLVDRFKTRLGHAIDQENLSAAKRVYVDVQDYLSKPGRQLPLEIYEHLLYAFLSLRHRDVVLPIWNDMVRAQHYPTCKTYTVLMRGCQNMRDTDAMEGFWRKMRTAGLQPDQYAWSTRIFGLMKNRKLHDVGMGALFEMSSEWKASEWKAAMRRKAAHKANERKQDSSDTTKKDVNIVPQPSTQVMNSAISALAGTDSKKIPKVLQWGQSNGIEPDLATYNVLLNVSMRQCMPEEAAAILQTMSERGIEPDNTTWTVILTAVFAGGTLNDMEPEEVGSHVVKLVQTFGSQTGGLDVKGYALCVDRLLKVYGNHKAAQEVLEHMASKEIKPTAEIYTILMTYYLQATPPDFAAAESLWQRIRNDNNGYGASLDVVFFDRMIELYAPHYATIGIQPMLSFLDTLESQGKKLSWRAMEQLAKALYGAGERDKLVKLVDKARRERDGGPGQELGFGHSSFWTFIASTGLLSGESASGTRGMAGNLSSS